MGTWYRSVVAALVVVLLVSACGADVRPTAPPPSPTSVGPTAMPTASPGTTPTATPSPTPTVTPTPAPVGAGGFRTPAPPPAGATWKGIRWRKVAADDPLAHVRSVTRWAGGFVAVGDIARTGEKVRTKVWASSDGRTWNLLGPDALESSSIVVGVAPLGDTVVAFTMEATERDANGSANEADGWILGGPWRSWTSADGRSWTSHPGPDFRLPSVGYDATPTLLAGAGNGIVALVYDGQPLAFTRDGATWETASLDAFPGGPAGWNPGVIASVAPGWLAIGSAAIVSADGRTWTAVDEPDCPAQAVLDGSRGLIVTGQIGDPHVPEEVWCQTSSGRAWRDLARYEPLGVAHLDDDSCRGTCPNGILVADGERIVAYRNLGTQAGWASRDGRNWRRLVFSGPRPTPWTEAAGYPFRPVLTPIGLLVLGGPKGVAWLGVPKT